MTVRSLDLTFPNDIRPRVLLVYTTLRYEQRDSIALTLLFMRAR